MAYTVGNAPAAYDALWLQSELQKIREAMSSPQPFAFLEQQNVAPPKPREGMIVLADGTNWNPGQGRGYYGYFGGQWVPAGLPTGTQATIAGKQPAGNYVTRGGNAVNVNWTAQGTTGALKLTIDSTSQNWIVNTLTGNIVQFAWDGTGLSVYIDGTRIGAVTTH
jgi:hypothetical protein